MYNGSNLGIERRVVIAMPVTRWFFKNTQNEQKKQEFVEMRKTRERLINNKNF